MVVDGKKKERIYKVKFCEVELGVLVDGVYGRDSQLKLVKEVMIQGMVRFFHLQSYDTKMYNFVTTASFR